MHERYSGFGGRRGSALWLGLVGAVCVAVAGWLLWITLQPQPSDVVRTDGETGESTAPAPVELRGAETPATTTSGTQVEQAPQPAALAADAAAAPRAIGGWTMDRVETLLDTFWGREPDIDRLLALIQTLGEHAVIDEQTVSIDPEDGTVRGRVDVPGLGLAGTFAIERNRMGVDLETTTGIDGVEARTFTVGMRLGDIGIEQATAYIHHLVYEDDQQRHHDLAVRRHPVGWEIRTNRAKGTVARPLFTPDPFAYEYDDKGPIPIPTQYTEGPVEEIRDPIRIDTTPWQVWRDKIEPHKP